MGITYSCFAFSIIFGIPYTPPSGSQACHHCSRPRTAGRQGVLGQSRLATFVVLRNTSAMGTFPAHTAGVSFWSLCISRIYSNRALTFRTWDRLCFSRRRVSQQQWPWIFYWVNRLRMFCFRIQLSKTLKLRETAWKKTRCCGSRAALSRLVKWCASRATIVPWKWVRGQATASLSPGRQ